MKEMVAGRGRAPRSLLPPEALAKGGGNVYRGVFAAFDFGVSALTRLHFLTREAGEGVLSG